MHYMNNYQKGCEDGWDVREKSVGYLDACYFENNQSPEGIHIPKVLQKYTGFDIID